MAKKKRIKVTKYLFWAILLFVCGYVMFTLYEQQQEMAYLRVVQSQYIEKIEKIEKEVNQIQENINNANSDEYIEKIARQQLKMIGQDEMLFIDLGKRTR